MEPRSDRDPRRLAAEPTIPHRILAATDLGPAGDAAIRVAHERAAEVGGRLAVCHVAVDVPDEPALAARRLAEVEDELRRTLAREIGDGVEVEVFVLAGDPARQIDDLAERWNAELVVIGRPDNPSGVLARLFRPKLVDKVVRYAPCAVLVTRRSSGSGRVVVGTDFADPSMPVLQAAAAEQRRTGAVVHAIHCVPPAATLPIGDPAAGVVPPTGWEEIEQAMLARIEQAAAEVGLSAQTAIVRDTAAAGLLHAAEELTADLLIVGTHGRGGLARLALGSVAQHVVNDAPCSVMVVRLEHEEAETEDGGGGDATVH